MAIFAVKGANVLLVLILCMTVFLEFSGSGGFCANAAHSHSRKALVDFKVDEVQKDSIHALIGTGNSGNLVGLELRTVPSGPDPVHHNGGSPKKPRTTTP